METAGNFWAFLSDHLSQFIQYTAFANFTIGHLIMIVVGLAFIYLAIAKEYEPMLLIPIGLWYPWSGISHFGVPIMCWVVTLAIYR